MALLGVTLCRDAVGSAVPLRWTTRASPSRYTAVTPPLPSVTPQVDDPREQRLAKEKAAAAAAAKEKRLTQARE